MPQRPLISTPSSGSGVAAVTPVTPGIASSRSRTCSHERRALARLPRLRLQHERQHVIRIEPGIDAPQRDEAAQHQAGADEQDERQRHLGDDHAAAQSPAAAQTADRPPAERSTSMTSVRDARSAGTMPQSSAVTTPANTANASTAGSIATASSRGRSFGPEREQHLHAGARERQPPSAVPTAAITRLSASICRTSCPRLGADRGADRELAAAPGGAHDQQVRHVRAGDQQDERDRAHQRQNRRPHVADQIVEHRHDVEIEARRLLDRKLLAQIGGDAIDVRLRLLDVTPGFRRPITRNTTLLRFAVSKLMRAAVHMSGTRSTFARGGNSSSKSGASTPTICARPSPRSTSLPIDVGSPP